MPLLGVRDLETIDTHVSNRYIDGLLVPHVHCALILLAVEVFGGRVYQASSYRPILAEELLGAQEGVLAVLLGHAYNIQQIRNDEPKVRQVDHLVCA